MPCRQNNIVATFSKESGASSEVPQSTFERLGGKIEQLTIVQLILQQPTFCGLLYLLPSIIKLNPTHKTFPIYSNLILSSSNLIYPHHLYHLFPNSPNLTNLIKPYPALPNTTQPHPTQPTQSHSTLFSLTQTYPALPNLNQPHPNSLIQPNLTGELSDFIIARLKYYIFQSSTILLIYGSTNFPPSYDQKGMATHNQPNPFSVTCYK